MKKFLAILVLLILPMSAIANIRVIVPFAAGGAADTVARAYANYVGIATGKKITVENITGAGSQIATQKLIDSTDNVVMISTSSYYVNIARKTFTEDEFVVVSILGQSPLLVGTPTHKNHSCKSLRETKNPIFVGTAGKDSISSVPAIFVIEKFKNYVEVPYKGLSQATIDLVGGRIDIIFFASMLERQDITMIANTGPNTFEKLPSTRQCLGIPETVVNQFVVVANKNASKEFVESMNSFGMKFVKDPDQIEFFKNRAIEPIGYDFVSTQKMVKEQYKSWAQVYK